MGKNVGTFENARTFANGAIHTGNGLCSRAFVLAAPASARFPRQCERVHRGLGF
jgi:hypothetical protein